MKFEFEHHWGGKDTWYLKLERWAKKQPMPINILAQGMIEWLKKIWIDAKIQNTMREVDLQASHIIQEWEKTDDRTNRIELERGVFGDEGWSIEISNRSFGERTPTTSTGMDTGSDASRLQKDEGDQGRSS